MRIVLIGPPGAGKGTQCRRLVEYLDVVHLSTGQMLRELRGQNSALARWVASHMVTGELAPDHLVMRIVRQAVFGGGTSRGYLFDGFPRTLIQAQLLDEQLAALGQRVDLVFELRVPTNELVARLVNRAERENRVDDTAEAILARLSVYETQTLPLLDYYLGRVCVVVVNGLGSPDEVFGEIRGAIDLARGGGAQW